VLETWLPGDAFGPAIAGMLFGDREPGGRLPVTFPADETQGAATQRREFPGLTDPSTGRLSEAYFDEGVFVGYRWYHAHGQKPLFPFGHGLSYGEVKMDAEGLVTPDGGGDAVRVRLTNTGNHAATVVPQVYIGFPPPGRHDAHEPALQLKGFTKVTLAPGESRAVDVAIPGGAYRYWNEDTGAWDYGLGSFRVAVGRSADDIVWRGERMVVISR
jgi:beta-glucosidase